MAKTKDRDKSRGGSPYRRITTMQAGTYHYSWTDSKSQKALCICQRHSMSLRYKEDRLKKIKRQHKGRSSIYYPQ